MEWAKLQRESHQCDSSTDEVHALVTECRNDYCICKARERRLKGLTCRLFLFLTLATRRTPREEMEGQEEGSRGGGKGGGGAK